MGKAVIIASRGEGLYVVRREFDADRFEAITLALEARIAEATASENDLQSAMNSRQAGLAEAEVVLSDAQSALVGVDPMAASTEMAAFEAALESFSGIAGEILGLRQQIDAVIAARMAAQMRLDMVRGAGDDSRRPEELAWCADMTENATGYAGTIEIPGEPQRYPVPEIAPGDPIAAALVIRPQDIEPGYDAKRDGLLMPREWMTPEQVFFNAAILPGWQKWQPIYRAGVIVAVDRDAERCSVSIDAPSQSSADELPVNQVAILHDLPVEYMSCGIEAFEDGDSVVVEFQDRDWMKAMVIGFMHHPRPCRSGRFVWMPEGFSLWPRSDSAPNGWGLPIVAGEPTEGGPLPIVLVNRKEHNNYPDRLAGRSHRPVGLRYMPHDDATNGPRGKIGVRLGRSGEIEPQFSSQWQQEEYEADAGRWYAHWPEPMELSPIQQGMLDRTNEFRAAVGARPLYPALRGVYGGPADSMLQQMQVSTAQVHEDPAFEPGYRLFSDRVNYRAAQPAITSAREIILTLRDVPGEKPYQTGRRMADLWRTSPPHYGAMISDDYHGALPGSPLQYVGFSHLAAGRGTTSRFEDTADGGTIKPLDPPIVGTQGVQVFYGIDRQLLVYRSYWRGLAGTVSWHATSSCKYGLIDLNSHNNSHELQPTPWTDWAEQRNMLAIKGRMVPLFVPGIEARTVRGVIAAALAFVGGSLRLRVCTLNENWLIELWDGPAHESWAHFNTIGSFDPTEADADGEAVALMRYPRFSPDGLKCVFTFCRRTLHLGPALRQQQVNFGADPDGSAAVFGTVIDFVEAVGGAFSLVHQSRVEVTPTKITTDVIDEDNNEYRNEYSEECVSTYRWLADYDESGTLVWASVRVDCRTEQWAEYTWDEDEDYILDNNVRPNVSSQETVSNFSVVVEFPNGSEMTTTDMRVENWRTTGFFLSFHTLDILRPEWTAYTRHQAGSVGPTDDRPTVGAELIWMGETIKSKPDVTLGGAGPNAPNTLWRDGCAWGGGIARGEDFGFFTALVSNALYYGFATPRGAILDLVGVLAPSFGGLPPQHEGDCTRDPYPANIFDSQYLQRSQHPAGRVSWNIAPRLHADNYDPIWGQVHAYALNMWEYGGELILSGLYTNPLGRLQEQGFWEPEEGRMLWRATFDLASAVGKPLGNNIEPVGVV